MSPFSFDVQVHDPVAARQKITEGFASKKIPVNPEGQFNAEGYAGNFQIIGSEVRVVITDKPAGVFNWMIVSRVKGFLDGV